MEFKGTKGKWHLHELVYENSSGIITQAIASYRDSGILVANAYGRNNDTSKANAKLIAAAPEMFEMLKELSKHHQGGHSEIGFKIKQLLNKITQ